LTDHLRPTAAIAADVLLPGDPGLALTLAKELLDKPRMANHSHGLWGYSGRTAAGRELTIQATGIGGPSAAVVVAELAAHGARRAIRIGTCSALDPSLAAGDPVVAAATLAADGASRALSDHPPAPDPALTTALASAAGAPRVTTASSDLFHDPDRPRRRRGWLDQGAAVTDLESAAVLAVSDRLGLVAAAGLVVAETANGEHDEAATELRLLRLGRAGTDVLAAEPSAAQPAASETSSLL
jgi:uridine phosphorylase